MYFAFYHRKVLEIYFGRLKFLEIVFEILIRILQLLSLDSEFNQFIFLQISKFQ